MTGPIDSNLVESSITSLVASEAEEWKVLFNMYKVEINRSIMTCDMAYGSFYTHLKNVRKDIAKGSYIMGEIFLELKVMGKSGRVDDINTTELDYFSTKILEIFQSQDDIVLKNKLDTRANMCEAMIDRQMEYFNKKKNVANRAVSLSLLTAGLGFAGFATAVGASVHLMSLNNVKSKFLLGASSGALLLASTLRLAEYLEYSDNFKGIIHNLSELKDSLSSLISAVRLFSAELNELIEQIKQYSQETKVDTQMMSNLFPSSESFFTKIDEMASKAKNLQIALVKMEISANEGVDFVKAGKSGLTTKFKHHF